MTVRQKAPAQQRRASEDARPQRNDRESPLMWLARRKDKDGNAMLSDAEFRAGERLRTDFTFGHMAPSVTANWSLLLSGGSGRRTSPDQGPDVHDHVAAAQERVRRALRAVGPDLAGILLDVCCHLKGLEACERRVGWPKRSGRIVLSIALRQLARHYGFVHEANDTDQRVRHWGAEGFRPRIDGGAA